MANYPSITLTDSRNIFGACSDCGAVVEIENQGSHDRFHQRLAEAGIPIARNGSTCGECGEDLVKYGEGDRWLHLGPPEPDHLAVPS